MTITKLSSLAAPIALFAIACADPGTSPTRALLTDGVSASVTQTVSGAPLPGVSAGQVKLCKTATGGGSGTFGFSYTVNGGAPTHVDVASGQCAVLYTSAITLANGQETVVITEDADQTDWALTTIDVNQLLYSTIFNGTDTQADGEGGYSNAQLADQTSLGTRSATAIINADMGRIVTFTNNFTPPSTGCTYTKGWYRNNGSSTVIAVDGRSVADVQAIFAATPGKPGSVTFGGNNTLLNLYQQFLAALQNLGGDAHEHDGPAAVDAAIDAVRAGTGGSGTSITTNLTQQQMSGYIATLAGFNEGNLAGWPHCED